ncbi:DUF1699 family protein [Thermococcus sp. JdF3]|uniref:DUF1699 family protein n=1 Tax=Thermococcus sp. JdF3 TaxID=1638258 RepID=UPI0014398AE7|nr:DUF1699 family protein [Thermococcus sp. JdF3]NJE01423.1 DUF1699 domain-containing protein [Thermococcus sp. JdF3]
MRVEIKARNNAELIAKLGESLNEDVTEVYINLRPTKEILVRILERAPNVRKISCPPSLYPKVSKRVIAALAQMGIELVPEGYPRGRPRKYNERTIREVQNLLMKGVPAKEISTRMGIPLRTVYYMIERTSKADRT